MNGNAQATVTGVQQLHRRGESSKSLHILAKTFHRHNWIYFLSKPSPSAKAPKCHPTCFSALYKSPPRFTKERGYQLGVCKCVYVGVCESVCVCACIRLGGKIKAAGEACLQSFKIWTSLLCLSCWQFSTESLVQAVPYSKKIIWIFGKALCETFSERSLNHCGLPKWWITHHRLESSSMLSQSFFFSWSPLHFSSGSERHREKLCDDVVRRARKGPGWSGETHQQDLQ